VLQDLIKFLTITDFYLGTVITPRSDQYLKIRENNEHNQLSTYDMAKKKVFKADSPERSYLHFMKLKLNLKAAK